MGRIHQLPPAVITKIAAGEVIERPASVVKELLENSVDAGASRIDIEIEQGGIDLIRVTDNGGGIHPDDLPLTFASHATSKLHAAEDLGRIGTLGFRGRGAGLHRRRRPGAPAIALARPARGGRGHLPRRRAVGGSGLGRCSRHLHRGAAPVLQHARAAPVPAHAGHGDGGRITEVFTRLALAQRSVHWTLRHNGRLVHDLPAATGLPERIGRFFGPEVRDQFYGVAAQHGAVALGGYVAGPACERGTAGWQYLFVNGRWVRDKGLLHAVQEAYRGLLMTGRYAVAFLYLDLPPEQVDVNVHPIKAEVRFRDGQALHQMVLQAIRSRLQGLDLTARLKAPGSGSAPQGSERPASRGSTSRPRSRSDAGTPFALGGTLPPGRSAAPAGAAHLGGGSLGDRGKHKWTGRSPSALSSRSPAPGRGVGAGQGHAGA